MPQLAAHILTTPHSGIRRMADIATAADHPITLVGGDPNFTTPRHIIDSAAEAARAGATGYTSAAGIPALREAIVSLAAAPEAVTLRTRKLASLVDRMRA